MKHLIPAGWELRVLLVPWAELWVLSSTLCSSHALLMVLCCVSEAGEVCGHRDFADQRAVRARGQRCPQCTRSVISPRGVKFSLEGIVQAVLWVCQP